MMGHETSGYYGWVPDVTDGKRSPAELYGWVPPRRNTPQRDHADVNVESCVECGTEFSVQRSAAVYECDRCIGRRD